MGRLHNILEKAKRMPKWLRWLLAGALIVLGIAGWFTPIIPGTALVIAGLLLLGEDTFISRWLLKKIHQIRQWKLWEQVLLFAVVIVVALLLLLLPVLLWLWTR